MFRCSPLSVVLHVGETVQLWQWHADLWYDGAILHQYNMIRSAPVPSEDGVVNGIREGGTF